MKCPIDGDTLTAGKAEAHAGYGCNSCKGSWLSKSYIDSIQYTKEFESKKFFEILSSTVNKNTDATCPVNCGQLSLITGFEGVSYCVSCSGVWFEKKALKSMLGRYQNTNHNAAFADVPNATVGVFDLFIALFK